MKRADLKAKMQELGLEVNDEFINYIMTQNGVDIESLKNNHANELQTLQTELSSVKEELSPPNFTRHNNVIEKYNSVAIKALSSTDTIINDLYTLTTTFPDEYRSDWVHFYTPMATDLIGKQVVAIISSLLGIPANEINIKDFKPENYSKSTIGY